MSTVLPLLMSVNLSRAPSPAPTLLHTGSHEPLWPLLSSPGFPASAVCLIFLHHHSPQTLLCKHFRGQWLTARGCSCQELHCRIPAHNPLPERCAFSPPCEIGNQGQAKTGGCKVQSMAELSPMRCSRKLMEPSKGAGATLIYSQVSHRDNNLGSATRV